MASYLVFCLLLVSSLLVARGFVLHGPMVRSISSTAVYSSIFAGTRAEIEEGGRKIVETAEGSIIVTNQGGKFFAVNAKCPHLGLPMKTGEISTTNGQPVITCKFHNSQFQLEDGKCVQWCKGVMGMPGTGFLAGAMGKMGGKENSPATTYQVKVVQNNPDDNNTHDPADSVYLVFDDVDEKGLA